MFTYLLTYSQMPSDKHNSRTTQAIDLISSLINIALSRDVPFHQLQQLQCLHHGATYIPLCAPIFLHNHIYVTICSRPIMASVWGIRIAEALFILFLVYNVMKRVTEAESFILFLLCMEVSSLHFTSEFSIFSIMAGWIAEMLFMLFFAYIAV